jgi:hypothetical protein
MAIATPLIVASRFRWFGILRVTLMIATAVVALAWIAARLGLASPILQ